MRDTGFPVFDADNHLYESPEALTEYLPAKYRREIQFVQVRGRTRLLMKNRLTDYIPNPTFDRVARPGAHVDYYRGTNPEGKTLLEMTGEPMDCIPAFREPAPRLELFDQLGVHRALMFPTIANLVEYTLDGDPDLTHAAIHAINQWIHETWTFAYRDRIFTTPVLTLGIVEEAIKELEWLLERGAKAVLVRPGPVTGLRGSRSLADPELHPVWARIEEAGIPVAMHASFPPLTHYYELWEKPNGDNAFKPNPLKMMLLQHREMEDAISAMICQNLFSRFPRLRVLSVENGAEWVPNLLHQLDKVHRQMPQDFEEHPVEVFKRNMFINPFWEDDVAQLVDLLGADRLLFGSDYPHPEGLAEPTDYYDELDGLDEPVKRMIMSDNANNLLGLAPAA